MPHIHPTPITIVNAYGVNGPAYYENSMNFLLDSNITK